MGFELVYGVGGLLLLLALFWGATQYRNRRQGEQMVGDRKTRELYRSEDGQERSNVAVARELERQSDHRKTGERRTEELETDELRTEDEMARDSLGGVKGSPDLPPAPMTPQQKKNTPKPVDPGHPA